MTRGPIPGQARGIYRNNLKKTPAEDGPNYQEALDLIRGFVRDYWVSNGFSPAVDEIARECGYHPSSIYYWVHRMREKGDLLFEDKVARSFRLPGQTVTFSE